MEHTDELNSFGNPIIDLPDDIGDGPFWSAPPEAGVIGARPASTTDLLNRREPFQDNWMTDNAVLGPSERISIGRFHVSDSIQPGAFRRVNQTFTHVPSRDLNATGTFEIQFTGAGQAIVRQATHATQSASGALANALLALDDGALIPYPTMYAQSTTFKIRLRMPGYEPGGGGVQIPDPYCFDPASEHGQRLLTANRIEEFTFGNSARERKTIPINYDVGRSIPVAFDIVNLYESHICIVDFFVDVYINRTAQNEAAAQAAEPAASPAPVEHTVVAPHGRISPARQPYDNRAIPYGSEMSGLDWVTDENPYD